MEDMDFDQVLDASLVLEGLELLKTYARLVMVVYVLGFIALALLFLFAGIGALLSPGATVVALGGWLAVALVLGVISLIIAIVAVYGYLLPSANRFATWSPEEFSTPLTLMKLGLVWGVILLLIAIPVFVLSAVTRSLGLVLGALALLVIASILLLLGLVGKIIYFFRLGEAFNSSTYRTIAVLLIVALILSFIPIVSFISTLLNFIATLLIYVETRSIIQQVSSSKASQ